MRSGQATILNDEQDRSLVPSVVYYGENENLWVPEAFAKAAIDPKNTIISVFKRLIGRSLADVQSRYTNLPYEFVESENGLPLLVTHQGQKSPIEVSADILSRFKSYR